MQSSMFGMRNQMSPRPATLGDYINTRHQSVIEQDHYKKLMSNNMTAHSRNRCNRSEMKGEIGNGEIRLRMLTPQTKTGKNRLRELTEGLRANQGLSSPP
jgi:hypothetical protein